MKKTTVAVLLAAIVAVGAPASAKKARPKASPTNRARLGTTQLSGENALVGVTYTLGKANPINITLDKAEYSVEPVIFGRTAVWPKKNEKALVLHYTLHNPNRQDFRLTWSTLRIIAVDPKDRNWSAEQNLGMEATHEKCQMSLKPAQKTRVYACILVPAQGVIPKVIFQSGDDLVLRYDLRGKVKPLPAPIADPADPSGATAHEVVPARMGAFYPMMGLHARIDSAAFTDESVNGRPPKAGNRYLAIIGTARNNVPGSARVHRTTFKPSVIDAVGGQIRWNGEMYYASRDEKIDASLSQNEEVRFKYVFEIPQGAQPRSFVISQAVGREYSYDLSGVQ